jgi:hypothetical protein
MSKYLKRRLLKTTLKRYLFYAACIWLGITVVTLSISGSILKPTSDLDIYLPPPNPQQGPPPLRFEDKSRAIIEIAGNVFIDNETFREMNQLKRIEFSAAYLGEIRPGWFTDNGNAPNLAEIYVHKDNPNYSSDKEGNLYNKEGTKLIFLPRGKDRYEANKFKSETLVLPSGVIEIGEKACEYVSYLKKVTFNNNLEKIGRYAFRGCSSLEEISLPGSVKELDDYAFYNCRNLALFSFASGNRLNRIGIGAFQNCYALESISIPGGVSEISSWCFQGCKNLQSVTLPSALNSIGDFAFRYCVGLRELFIPSSINYIGRNAFESCETQLKFAISAPGAWPAQWNHGLKTDPLWNQI